MKSTQIHSIISIISVIVLVGCGGGSGGDNTNTPTTGSANSTGVSTTVLCKEIKPILLTLEKKYILSKDDYAAYALTKTAYYDHKDSAEEKDSEHTEKEKDDEDEDLGGLHNEGRNCLACHNFASAGTVFTTLHASNNTPGASGYRIQFNTGIVYSSARGTGNSRTSNFPNSNFTAQVIDPNGNIVNSSADMSHNASRRACNNCHSSSGNSGAPGRITSAKLSSSAPTPTGSIASTCVSFNNNVLPILQVKCKNCHGSNGNFSITTVNATFANISALKGSAQAGGTYLLDKGSNTVRHGGGSIITPSSAEYTTIKAWITEGALNN